MDHEQLLQWTSRVKFKEWEYHIQPIADQYYLQISFQANDTFTGTYTRQDARPWLLDPSIDESGFIRVAHMATVQAMMHEVDETFLYDGARLFNPHMNFRNLASMVKNKVVGLALK